ncbi:hypothetical protein LTR78_010728 [Recurvomyces mirabilis]|uniref:GST N-terminal domain-containing protein n=1 Tax=Recurvomyces mirabilis TaxID=574656 RepID=A0AAE0WI42_9PEZI|nr:hypothetical protein LTR78_010728 [Recurvomyces mirabilis]KAK5152530.1 hypothetical protein LTS14_008477 [Recurvomyces mirabilis]
MSQPIISFDYDGSPYGQKIKLLLTAAGVNFQKCDQPRILPRPDLAALGITYRRIPLLAVGKDVYADTSIIIDVIMSSLAKNGALATSPADKAFEVMGNTIFREVLGLLDPDVLPKEFIQDRKTIFPVIARPDFKTMRPSTVAQIQSRYKQIEDTFFTTPSGPFPSGDKLSLSDIHILWSLRWGLTTLGAGKEPGCGKDAFPKIWKAIESLPEPKPEILSSEKTIEIIKKSGYSAKGPTSVEKDDPLGFKEGTVLSVESSE